MVKSKKKIRHTYEYVRDYFQSYNCVLISKEYKNNREHLEFICSCGNKHSICFSHFQQGKRCNHCRYRDIASKKKLLFKDVEKIYKDRGCELLEIAHINSKTPYTFRCQCGSITQSTFDSFKKASSCNICTKLKRHYKYEKIEELKEMSATCRSIQNRCNKHFGRILGKKKENKIGNTETALGYTKFDLLKRLESFDNWCDIKNEEWTIDHIFPIKAFVDYGILDEKLINDLENLQPMTREDNTRKSAIYNIQDFEKWLKEKEVDFVKHED